MNTPIEAVVDAVGGRILYLLQLNRQKDIQIKQLQDELKQLRSQVVASASDSNVSTPERDTAS